VYALGQTLTCIKTNTSRFRIDRYFTQGRNFDLLIGADLENDERAVVIKAIRYDASGDAGNDAKARDARRDLLDVEMLAMETVSPRFPMPCAMIFVDPRLGGASEYAERPPADFAEERAKALAANAHDEAGYEPLYIYEFVEGKTLDVFVHEHGPTGIEPSLALRLLRQIAEGVDALHEHGFIHRALAPEHIVVTPQHDAFIIGLGNATRKRERVSTAKTCGHALYTASEIDRELSGRFLTPHADVYSLGGLLAFMLAGEHPTGDPARPHTRRAIERIGALPSGYGLLVAHCTQPLHKKRSRSARELLRFLDPAALPDQTTPSFGELALANLWSASRAQEAPVGRMNPGPLVDRARETTSQPPDDLSVDAPVDAPVDETKGEPAEAEPMPGAEAMTDAVPQPTQDMSDAPSTVRMGVRVAVGLVSLALVVIAIIVTVRHATP